MLNNIKDPVLIVFRVASSNRFVRITNDFNVYCSILVSSAPFFESGEEENWDLSPVDGR